MRHDRWAPSQAQSPDIGGHKRNLPPVPHPDAGRFLTVPPVAEELATSEAQVIAMLRRLNVFLCR